VKRKRRVKDRASCLKAVKSRRVWLVKSWRCGAGREEADEDSGQKVDRQRAS
jgi:hypothetical protein